MGAEFLFMDDNARSHRANIVDECCQSEDINRMDWPAYSPDLNRIEHVWDMLGRRIVARQPHPTYQPTSESERCYLHEDQAQVTLDSPVVKKTATSSEMHAYSTCVFSNHTKRLDEEHFGSGAALDTYRSKPPFGVVPRPSKLNCSGMDTCRL
ncbi:transposable element Tcb1 transposase [Trichonephila clavipes]|nr:transposable element Tcb1 transposase [Trichonephila clavipes]